MFNASIKNYFPTSPRTPQQLVYLTFRMVTLTGHEFIVHTSRGPE